MNRTRLIPVSILAAIAGASALAGPLNPPAGPIAPSYKTLSEVEPRTAINSTNTPGDSQYEYIIAQPGAYYLTANLNIGGSKHAIKIAADNVTIDFCGFSMICTAQTTGTGITSANIAHNNFRVLNGAIRGGFQGGINVWGVGSRVERMTVQNTFGDAIWLQGQAVIRDCVTSSNSGYGIICGTECTISGCSSDADTMGGIYAVGQAVVERCTANNSTNADGIFAFNGSVIRDCTANGNHAYGIATGYLCQVDNCSASNNLNSNFELGMDNQARGCTCRGGDYGITADFGCTLIQCEAELCSYDGFHCNGEVLLQNCRAQQNGRDGISGGTIATILNCQANNNFSAGFEVFGSGRLEGNDAINNAVGFKSTGTGALFIRNSATTSNGTNYSIAAGNTVGPIVTSANIATNTNPAANFSY